MKKMIFGVLALFFTVSVSAVEVDPARAVIVVDKKADGTIQFAAQELQKYLQMITGTKIAIVSKPAAPAHSMRTAIHFLTTCGYSMSELK